MITTRFLTRIEYPEYRNWLLQQDSETLMMYFGISASPAFIDNIVDKILADPAKHHFLVAFDHNEWLGVCHIAETGNQGLEFGFTVAAQHRKRGIADTLMDEAMTWAQNRGYRKLFLHCLNWNQPIKKLCIKHGLELHSIDGDAEVDVELPPPSFLTIGKEIGSRNINMWSVLLDRALRPV